LGKGEIHQNADSCNKARLLRPKNKIDQSDLDIFLFEANKAWWLAKGKTITISNIKEFLTKI